MLDLAPTICEIAGVRPTRAFDGMSMIRRILNPAAGWRRDLRFEYNAVVGARVPHHSGIISMEPYNAAPKAPGSQLYSYVLIPPTNQILDVDGQPAYQGEGNWTTPEVEVYDLTADPHQMANLVNPGTGVANNPANQGIVNTLGQRRQRVVSV
jgi:hypothetical protein